jgi:glycosyltransferase involved in cell wall biosynthesis
MKKRILYIAPHRPERSPGQRFRFEQFIPFFEENGYNITYSNILSQKDDQYFYGKGNYLYKIYIVLKSFFIRLGNVVNSSKYDVVIVYREAWFLGSTFFEKWLSKRKTPMVFDFDDSIWLNDTSEANQNLKWLKKPEKTGKICHYANLVIVGNGYLAKYAQQYNPNTLVVPTTIETNFYKSSQKNNGNPVNIGWIGSYTTIKHFKEAIPVLKAIKDKYKDKVMVSIIVDKPLYDNNLKINHIPWSKALELENLDKIDIGIMPLPNNQWTKGKCGFKGIQYMAMGKPTIMSPVGVNTEIIHHGENGLLADTKAEWIEQLCTLIENPELRKELGNKGRQTIEESFSVDSQKTKFLEALEKLIEK